MKNDFFYLLKRYDFSFFGVMSAIFLIGILNLYSATSFNPTFKNLYLTQLMWFVVAVVNGFIVSFIDIKNIYRHSYFIYAINVILLILVFFIGTKAMGGQRWLSFGSVRFQPSELMKISLVLVLARWFSKNNLNNEVGIRKIIIPFLLSFVPAILIILEPDLGTGLLVLLIFFMIAFYRRLKIKSILIICLISIVSGTTMYNYGLKEYQKRRILTFLDPQADAHGSGYNAIQSEIAIGSGQLLGKGFKKSSQAALRYLPENHTDFVFSVFNEEHGFFGSVVLILLYLILLMRFIWLSTVVLRFFDSIVCIGLMSIVFWHTFINMMMVMGLLPIVGLPLPLMSYGGSGLVLFFICCGIATSISNARNIF